MAERTITACDACGKESSEKIQIGPVVYDACSTHLQQAARVFIVKPRQPLLACSVCGKQVHGPAGLRMHSKSHAKKKASKR